MTGEESRWRRSIAVAGRIRSLAGDSRARIPFALIGVLLLVSAGLFVLQADTGSDASVDTDADTALEQTDAATATAVRDGATRATEIAAEQPLTSPAATPYGEALHPMRPFESYLEALVYLEVRDRLDGAGQEVGDVETRVRLPEVTDPASFEAALDRVSLTPGMRDRSLEPGTVQVTVEGITIEAVRDGEVIATRERDVQMTLPTPLFELHDRASEYQDRLNNGISESGFGQRFNARIYALGWARGYAQYGGAPVTEVIANRHVVPAANDAIYRTQQDVFGTTDPRLNSAIRRGWFCMAMQDAGELYSGYADSETQVPEQLCEASEWIFGSQATGDPPDAPGVTDLLGSAPGMDAEHTVGLNETAKIPLAMMLSGGGDDSLWSAVSRIYEIETALDLSVETVDDPTFSHSPPAGYTGSGTRLSLETEDVTVQVSTIEALAGDEAFHRIEGNVSVKLEERREFTREGANTTYSTTEEATGTLTATFELELSEVQASPDANIDTYHRGRGVQRAEIEPAYEYERGPERLPGGVARTVPGLTDSEGFVNYAEAPAQILDVLIDRETTEADGGGGGWDPGLDPGWGPPSDDEGDEAESSSGDRIEQWLEQEWAGATSTSDISLSRTAEFDVTGSYLHETDLKETITADLIWLQEQVSDISVSFERSEVVDADGNKGPFARLAEEVREQRREYLLRDEPFENVGQKAVYEARYAYFEIILDKLDTLDDAHGAALDGLDEELGDLGLGDALSYLQQGLTAEKPDPEPMRSSSLTDEVTYEVSGSPTYLVAENVTSEDVPAVYQGDDGAETFDPLAASNRSYLKLPYESVVDSILDKLANLLSLGDPDAELSFQMAGEALRAGDLAIDAAEADGYGDADSLKDHNDELRDATADAIEDSVSETAAQTAFRLYPNDVESACIDYHCTDEWEEHFGESLGCSDDICELQRSGVHKCTSEYCRLAEDSTGEAVASEIADAVAITTEAFGGSVSDRAMAIGDGNLSRLIGLHVARQIPDDERPSHAHGLPENEWEALVVSIVQQTAPRAASEQHVTLDDTETVENLDTEIRQTLESVSEDIVQERVAAHYGAGEFNLSDYDNWVDGVDTPVRVPAGLPLLPIPSQWYATVNVWDVKVEGEYARFEVTATQGTPESATGVTYVREDRPVELEVAGEQRRLGEVEPIHFDGRSLLVVVVPPGGIGVGDRDDEDPEWSPTWPGVGYDGRPDDILGGIDGT